MLERGNFLPKENTRAISDRLSSWGVDVVAWDFDGTLIKTADCFKNALYDVAQIIHSQTNGAGYSLETIQAFLREVNHGLVPEFGIHPSILEHTVYIAGKRFNVADLEDAYARIEQMYLSDVPVVFEGAREAVEVIGGTHANSWLVTHAEASWTWHKRASTNFIGTFERIECLDVKEKKSDQWEGVFERNNIDPARVLVIGDNFHADVAPVVGLGGRGIWVKNGKERVFSPEDSESSQEFDSERIMKVEQVGEIIDALVK